MSKKTPRPNRQKATQKPADIIVEFDLAEASRVLTADERRFISQIQASIER